MPEYLPAGLILGKKTRYLKQINRMKQGLTPGMNFFTDDLIHNSINLILGEELVKKLIEQTHKELSHARRKGTRE
jgi:hypothetical protein